MPSMSVAVRVYHGLYERRWYVVDPEGARISIPREAGPYSVLSGLQYRL